VHYGVEIGRVDVYAVESAVAIDGACDQCADRGLVSDIERLCTGLAAGCGDPPGDRVRRSGPMIANYDPRAVTSEGLRRGFADATAATGHHEHFPGQRQHRPSDCQAPRAGDRAKSA